MDNSDYSDPFRNIARGGSEAETSRDHILTKACCSESGVMGKTHSFFRSLDKTLWDQEIVGLIETPRFAQDAYLSKGGFPT